MADLYTADYTALYGVTPPVFPLAPLDLECQLDIAGTWTDITSSAYQRDGQQPPVVITRGRADETSQASPATCAWQLNNRDGRFSPRNPLSPYYGSLARNTPVRWSVPAQTNYLRLENNSQDRAYVNDDTNLHISGSIDMRIELVLTDWRGCVLAEKYDGGTHGSWYWTLNIDGTLTFTWIDSSDASHTVTSSQPVPYANGTFALRATMDATTGNVTFYTSTTIGGTWTQLGNVASGTSGAATSILVETTSALVVGYSFSFATAQVFGGIHEYQLYNGIAGTLAADGIFTAQTAGAASWTDVQGNLWQLAGGAEISSRNYRFHGEMSQLPPRWDVTGNDMWVAAQAGGPLRRLAQGTNNVLSAIRRAISLQSGSLTPLAYWPLEDASNATQFGPAIGPNPMTWIGAAPTLATDSSFVCSSPLPTLSGAVLLGQVPSYTVGSGSTWTVRFLADIPTLPASSEVLFQVNVSGGLAATVTFAVNPAGTVQLTAYDSALNVIASTGAVAWTGGIQQPLWWSIEAQPSGSNVQYSLVSLEPGASAGLAASATSSASGIAGYVNEVLPGGPLAGVWSDTVIGHVQVQYTWVSLFSLAGALEAWAGELAATRFARLGGENGYAVRILGSPGASAAMGVQGQATLQALLQECETADMGQIFEPRVQVALGYRTLASMCAQSPVLTVDYSQSQPGGVSGSGTDSGLDPTYDDLLSKNDWTVTRGAASGAQGATLQVQLNDGSAMSVSNPPVGMGDYATTVTVNTDADSQLADVGGWLVHVGTVNDLRWPVVPVNLARTEMAALQQAAAQLEVGDMLEVANPPDLVVYDPARQLALGFKESLGGFHWTMEFNAVPASPYDVIVLDDPVLGRLDTDGSTLHSTTFYPQTTLLVSTNTGFPLWTTSAADFPFDIAISGMRLTVTNITGTSSPQNFSVTPAVNGVQKTLSIGADVRLWTPPILAVT